MTLTLRSPMPSTSWRAVSASTSPGTKTRSRTGVEIGAASLDRVGDGLLERPVAASDQRVGAGVQHEGHALRLTCGDDRLDGRDRLVERSQPVLDVRADDSHADGAADGLAGVAVAGVQVGR